jgi:SAM-dependent methyltransferase
VTADTAATVAARLRRLEETVARLEDELRRQRGQTAPDGGPRFAALYPRFQDRFRGPEQQITQRLTKYLPDAQRVLRSGGVVDVGPGRGEWLSLLGEHGVPAYGIEINDELAERSRAKGVHVVSGDAVTHLRRLRPGSVDMVSAFHVIEHLDTETLLALLEAAHAALRSGGCLLVETPNPRNLVMGACDFYNDPTHRSPLPPDFTAYVVAAAGFTPVEVRHVHPSPPPPGLEVGGPLAELVLRWLYGPQDYAVVGHKPAP